MTNKPLCIYHGACDDGFAAAWAVRRALGDDVEFYPGVYQKEPPDVAGRHVMLVDFSYKRPVLEQMASTALSVLILDHHKTAAEDLADLKEAPQIFTYRDMIRTPAALGLFGQFDMNRSGAAMAWDYFHAGAERLTFIQYVQDRDLWRKQLPHGDEFTIALRSYPQKFETWDWLIERGAEALIAEGHSLQRYYRLRIEEFKQSAYIATIAGIPVWITNAPYFAASEAAGELAERPEGAFGVAYFEVERGRFQYSLRSRGGFDVSEIAKKFGGGGHKAAAGFTVDAPVHVTP